MFVVVSEMLATPAHIVIGTGWVVLMWDLGCQCSFLETPHEVTSCSC